jgi:PhnB protein
MSEPANGAHTSNGRPLGFSTITPFLAVTPARDAITFYCDVFCATVVGATEFGGVIAHAELDLGNGRLQLGEPSPDYHLARQSTTDDACYSLAIYVPDVDAVVDRAVAAGAVVREPVVDFVSGDRYGSIRDPFGVRWSVMTRVEDISDAESGRRVDQWAAQYAASQDGTTGDAAAQG